ncbi:MAG: nickel pincer cofactor biosynthesis protein LarC [Bacillota bacterium]|nr:nickel pincer cofactor biosynthesis protein LarC [Bacillota bacterium]
MAPLIAELLYIDAPTGLAGDMLLAGLLDCGAELEPILRELRKLDLGPWELKAEKISQHGIMAMQVDIEYPHQHQHRHLSDIRKLIQDAGFPPAAEERALLTFQILAQAEAAAHGCDIEEVHFHEVGAVDSILDICAVSLALHQLQVEQVYCSELPLSRGWVDCAHGRLPVPAPAVANLLLGMKVHGSTLEGELITPTGAALLKAMGAKQIPPPAFGILCHGRGAGHRELSQPNAVHLILGDSERRVYHRDVVDVLRTNIDDSSGETLAVLWEKAFAMGAMDMCYSPLLMKKGRPAWQLQMIVPEGQADKFACLIFAETGSIGCRVNRERRLVAERNIINVYTQYGKVAVKISGNNIAPEAESARAAAAQAGVPFKEVYAAALTAAYSELRGEEG